MFRHVTTFVIVVALAACGVSAAPEPARAAYETQARSAWLYDVETDTVLFEKNGRSEGQIVGRSPYLQPVHASADSRLLGEIHPVEIAAASKNSLSGVVLAA